MTTETETALSRREATLRSLAAACLAGIALAQAIGLPALLSGRGQFAVVSLDAMALCVALSVALAAAPASASRALWRVVGALSALVLGGWTLAHAVALPGAAAGAWTALPGAGGGVLAAACLVLAVAARRTPGSARGRVASALALALALSPGALALAQGAGAAPGASTAHVHALATAGDGDIELRQGRGGDHYVIRVDAPPAPPVLGAALDVAAAFVLVYGAVGYLRRRSAPARPLAAAAALV
jgi:hypothetical protein